MFSQTHTIAFERLWLHGKSLHRALQRAQYKQYSSDQIEYYQHQLLITQRCLAASLVVLGGHDAGK